MDANINNVIAGRLDEVARIFEEQGANRFRVQAYRHAATILRGMDQSVSEVFENGGLEGLEKLPGIGESIARSIRDILLHGRLAMLDRLRGEHDSIAMLASAPGVGRKLALKLHDDLGIESLEELEAAAHDGRLEGLVGFGPKRIAGIRDTLAHRLGRVRERQPIGGSDDEPSIGELLEVDLEYRREAAAHRLKTIAPRRFNPSGEAWLPVLHTVRAERHYTALFSNTARAHARRRTRDWVVLYLDGRHGGRHYTVITSEFGRLKGRRIVRGRERECEAFHRVPGTRTQRDTQ
jgi:Holliday junction resolvasome RuvABC DNA-binding subunit